MSETLAFHGDLPHSESSGSTCPSTSSEWSWSLPVFCYLQQQSRVFLCIQGLPGMEVFIWMLKPHALCMKIKLSISFPSCKIPILLSFSSYWEMYQLMFIPYPWRILYIMTKLWAILSQRRLSVLSSEATLLCKWNWKNFGAAGKEFLTEGIQHLSGKACVPVLMNLAGALFSSCALVLMD